MIDIEKLRAVKTIIVHDNCSDGLMSALLLKDAYAQCGLTPELRFVQYGTEAYKALTPAPNTLFCDFSPFVPEVEIEVEPGVKKKVPDPEKLRAWVDSGTLILDHHKGAEAVVRAFGEHGVFGDESKHPGVSGAWLAFREVWVPFYKGGAKEAWAERITSFAEEEPLLIRAETVEELAKQLDDDLAGRKDAHDDVVIGQDEEVGWARNLAALAGIRDTWQNKHERWREACILNEVLRFYPNEEWLEKVLPFHPGNRGFWNERLKLGNLLWSKHEKGIKKCIEKSWRFTSARGTKVLVFEGVRSSSDVAEEVDTEVDLVMAFDYEVETPKDGGAPQRKIIYSTRSHTSFDCKDFAKRFGGGGHTKAAGFNIVLDPQTELSSYARSQDPYTLAETLVRIHEEKKQGT